MDLSLSAIRRLLVGVSFASSALLPLAMGGSAALAQDVSATVALAPNGNSMMLTDGEGWTVYRWQGDDRGVSRCVGECSVFWPPVTTDGALVASSEMLPHLGTIAREDGTLQVTFDGAPLYRNFYDVSGVSPTTGYFSPAEVHPGLKLGEGSLAYGYRWSVVALDSRLIGDVRP